MNVAPDSPESAPKRILYVITKANWGGAQRYVFDLAVASKKAGFEVAVAYGVPGELQERLEAAGIRTIALNSLSRDIKLTSEFSAFGNLVRVFQAERPDVVHINSSKAGALGGLAARIAGVPRIIFTAHGWAFNESRPLWQKIIFKLVYAFTILLSSYTICVSHKTQKDMEKWTPGFSKKMVVIYNGVHAAEYMTRAEARTVVCASLWPDDSQGSTSVLDTQNEIWLGMLSELHPTKRVEDAIEAVKILTRTYPEIKLVVLGEGEQRTYLEEKIKTLGLEESVKLAGFLENGPSYLNAFDIFVHTSRSEALGYAVIEAGFAGLPVVATRVGGIPEIIKNGVTGELVPPLVPKEVAKSVERYLQNFENAEKMGLLLQKEVQARFSLDTMISKTLEIYAG
jgi:glycosyltransferase involved in cell wall biosynthesis